MAKNLVLFSDGTGNSPGKLFKTNVWRVYQALDLKDSQDPKQPRQFACYDDGVGTSSFKPLAILGGAFGVGLARNVRDLYVFLCRMYEPGDRIYAFGFSRGAFTIRVLIGLVMTQGLLRYHGSEGELQRLARDAYRAYRAERFTSYSPLVIALRAARILWLNAWNTLLRRPHYRDAERIGRPDSNDAIKIEFVGLWDTVDAYGLPVDELTRAVDVAIWPLTMRDYNLNERVLRARHALAIDDERNAFHPRLWNEQPQSGDKPGGVPGGNLETRHIDDERISQVWFAGVHANVGGGYPDDCLSFVPLQWIMDEAARYGLRFEPQIRSEMLALSDENGPLYDSRRGLAGYYRYKPRRIEQLTHTRKVTVGRTKVHESVLRRIQVGHDGYAPIALPPGFAVVKMDGGIVDGNTYLQAAPRTVDADSPYAGRREHVYNWVWWRRVAYFVTLGFTLALALMPLFAPGTPACEGPFCFLTSPIAALGLLLPSFASAWTDAWSSHPGVSLPLLLGMVLGMRWGSTLEQRVCDEMRHVWYAIPTLRPASPTEVPAPAAPSALNRAIEGLRKHPAYRAAFLAITHGAMPIVFLIAIAFAAVALFGQLGFAWQASSGGLCSASGAAQAGAANSGAMSLFDLREPCAPTGIEVEKGGTYRVRMAVPAQLRWWDQTIPAGPQGFECKLPPATAVVLAAAVPLRRHFTEPWFQPMARIGATGSDTYALRGALETPPAHDRCSQAAPPDLPPAGCPPALLGGEETVFESVIVARSSGPLFLYVNDAIGLPGADGWRYFYSNNRGCARITVAPVLAEK